EVRFFVVMAICALIYAISRNNPFYGLLYTFVPMVEKSRAPIVALSVFHFAVTVLAALGADVLLSRVEWVRESRVLKSLLWLAAGLFALTFFKPDLDPRWSMSALIALLLAALFQGWIRGHVRREWALALVAVLVVLEQANEVGW